MLQGLKKLCKAFVVPVDVEAIADSACSMSEALVLAALSQEFMRSLNDNLAFLDDCSDFMSDRLAFLDCSDFMADCLAFLDCSDFAIDCLDYLDSLDCLNFL